MARATFKITAELVTQICQGLTPGNDDARYFRVVTNPLPADAKVVGIHDDGTGVVVVSIESNHVNDGDEITPQLQAVSLI